MENPVGRRRKSDLEPFTRWLEDTRGVSAASASHYASRLRRMLKHLEVVDREHLDELLRTSPFAEYPANYTSAWRAFVEYSATCGLDVPTPTPTASQKENTYAIPDRIADDLLYLTETSDLKRSDLALLRWHHLDGGPKNGKVWVEVPGSHGDFVQLHWPCVERIRDWAFPDGANPSGPWIPEGPGETEAMPERVVRRLLARRKRTRHQ